MHEQRHSFEWSDRGPPLRSGYLVHLPDEPAEDGERWPLLVFLHGAGERGDDLERVKAHGPPSLAGGGQELPFVIASPQCPPRRYWDVLWLSALLDELTATQPVDADRIYLTGISLGGYGAWHWACGEPERFAALAPICGGGNPGLACSLVGLPIWAFHGARDVVVPPRESEAMVDAVRDCGGEARLTVYPDVGHDSWTRTYRTGEVFDWLLEHTRSW